LGNVQVRQRKGIQKLSVYRQFCLIAVVGIDIQGIVADVAASLPLQNNS
jgi:hypothetical protein